MSAMSGAQSESHKRTLLLAGDDVQRGGCEEHERVGELVAKEPVVQRDGLLVDNVILERRAIRHDE